MGSCIREHPCSHRKPPPGSVLGGSPGDPAQEQARFGVTNVPAAVGSTEEQEPFPRQIPTKHPLSLLKPLPASRAPNLGGLEQNQTRILAIAVGFPPIFSPSTVSTSISVEAELGVPLWDWEGASPHAHHQLPYSYICTHVLPTLCLSPLSAYIYNIRSLGMRSTGWGAPG